VRVDGPIAVLDRWGRAALPGVVLLFFVLMTLAPLRAPYLSDALPLLPALTVFQFSLATPERLPGPLLLIAGILLDLLLGGPGAPVGVSGLCFVLIRESVVAHPVAEIHCPSHTFNPAIDLLGAKFILVQRCATTIPEQIKLTERQSRKILPCQWSTSSLFGFSRSALTLAPAIKRHRPSGQRLQ